MYRIKSKANIGTTIYTTVRNYFENVEKFMVLFTDFFRNWICSYN